MGNFKRRKECDGVVRLAIRARAPQPDQDKAPSSTRGQSHQWI